MSNDIYVYEYMIYMMIYMYMSNIHVYVYVKRYMCVCQMRPGYGNVFVCMY